ncbi:hypothetical protein SAMN02745146_1901 [Hymenobacter daecheongensis DSM 21074]|uniref:IPT/TIG domain-containing protein n=1 Tax=Hymenobacter daecheongensis DSM 21074 TaxID=1121955 RepID=A0A1M6F1A6_9BACT|nr:IPT/TIG domain-containing protein [Hymenobacter daecheongensis]SHI91508.1 hypothetical protein SAMN02745146_1901 [Hymenobacter daecheongensis DSM 21074]
MHKNITLFRQYASSGRGGWRFLLQLLVLLGLPLLGRAQALTQADFTGLIVPQYMASGTATRLPVLYRATVSNLTPGTTYRYYTQGATNSATGGGADIGGTGSGAGNPLLVNGLSGSYSTTSTASLTAAGGYETFTTDATGSYTGWFGLVNTGNTRFTGGNVVFPTIVLAPNATPTVIEKRLALNQGITVLTFAATATATSGTFIKGNSFASPRNLVALYDNTTGTGRPLAVTVVEPISVTITGVIPGYTTSSGDWNTLIPNANASGVRRVEERSVASGSVVNCNTDADGLWPSGAATANPTGGTTPVQLTNTDAPLNAGCGVAGTPTITVSTNGPLAFTTTTGTNSAVQTYTVAGTNLTADITITTPAGYQISSDGSTFSSTLTLAQTGGSVSTKTISVRLLGATSGTFNGNITNVSGTASQNVAVSGTVGTTGPVAPTITSFTPTSGPVGTVITLTGTDFAGATAVTISGTNAPTFTVNSNTQIVVTVPAGATSGAISVTTPAGTGFSTTNFTVTAPSPTPPTIASFTPASGPVGTSVTITGTNFTGVTAVSFNGIAATFTIVNATTITATVPTGATTGTIAVTNPDGTATSATSFTVTASAPTIASFTPASGPVGTSVTITGTNFTGATAVAFNGTAATTFNVVNATTITATVPAGATTGTIAVTTPGGSATSATSFTVTIPVPTITALAPAIRVAGSAGFMLTVTGTGFQTGATVTLNGTALTTTFVSATTLTAAVPTSALTTPGTYNVTVANAGGTSSVAATFTVSAATAGLFEDFEQGVKSGYATATVALQSGDWTLTDALIGTSTSDKFNGTRSVRVRGGGTVTMNFDKPNGAGVITLNAALYGSDTNVSLKLEISSDGGATYTDITGTAPALTATLASYSFTANRAGNIRLRISSTNTVAASNPRFNLDDISISDYTAPATPVITVTPASLAAFSTTTGTPSASQSFSASASNLTADLTVTAPAGYEVSLSQTTGFGATVTVVQTGGTVTNALVYVRLTGAASGTFAGNVTVGSTGAATQNVAVTGTVTTPAPTIVSFTPASGPVGTTVTITGTNFTSATAVTFNGLAAVFTVVNATTITATVPTGATSGTIAVTTPGGTVTSASSFTVIQPNPAPAITSLSPNTAVAGSAAFTLTVNGTGFITGSVVNFNGAALVTTFVSATQLTAAVPATAVATAGTYNVTVTNAAPGGGTSAAATFTVTTPAPTIASFTPASGPVGTTVTITGTNFTGATAVAFNGTAATIFTVVNATTITATVPTGATTGTIAVTTPGGTATSAASFTVVIPNPAPTITSLSPTTIVAGSAGFTLTVNGTGFVSGSGVNFNGVALATTFVSATRLTAAVPASAIAVAASVPVTVTSPAPGGGTSAAVTFTVTINTAARNAQNLDGFALYPNPTLGMVTIELPKTWNSLNQPVRLTDLSGRVVLQTRLGAAGQLDLRALPAGIYMLTVGEGQQTVTRRVQKN